MERRREGRGGFHLRVCLDMCETQGNGMILGRRKKKKENRKYSRFRGTGRTIF